MNSLREMQIKEADILITKAMRINVGITDDAFFNKKALDDFYTKGERSIEHRFYDIRMKEHKKREQFAKVDHELYMALISAIIPLRHTCLMNTKEWREKNPKSKIDSLFNKLSSYLTNYNVNGIKVKCNYYQRAIELIYSTEYVSYVKPKEYCWDKYTLPYPGKQLEYEAYDYTCEKLKEDARALLCGRNTEFPRSYKSALRNYIDIVIFCERKRNPRLQERTRESFGVVMSPNNPAYKVQEDDMYEASCKRLKWLKGWINQMPITIDKTKCKTMYLEAVRQMSWTFEGRPNKFLNKWCQ